MFVSELPLCGAFFQVALALTIRSAGTTEAALAIAIYASIDPASTQGWRNEVP